MLNDILDFSRMEAGRLELETVDFDLRSIVEGVADLMAVKAHEKGIEMVCFIHPDVPTRLSGDPSRLRQILVNLVSNAVKFTHSGFVSLRVDTDEGSTDSMRFRVADTGIGVPPEKRHLLFQRFSQVDASMARRYGGAGLGLSIVKGLVETMGGRIEFESEEGKGSVFSFFLRLARQPGFEKRTVLALPGKRILVADQSSVNRSVVMDLLRFWKCDAFEAEDAGRALAVLKNSGSPFDAAVLDFEMPGGGQKLAALIVQDPSIPRLPLIMMTPPGQATEEIRPVSSAFTGFVAKPIKQGELGACLASVLGRKPIVKAAETAPVYPPVSRKVARSRHRILLVEDNPANQEVAMAILEFLGYPAELAPDALSAVDAMAGRRFSAVLTDCQLPGMDGYDMARLVRDPSTCVLDHRIPIIALTAHALAGDREKCIAAGMDDYMTKPIRAAILEEILDRWCFGAAKPESDTAQPEAASLPSAIEFDKSDLIDRVMGNEDLARRVAARFIEDIPRQLAALSGALSRASHKEVRSIAHAVKGSAANVGALPVSTIAARLERLGDSGDLQMAAEILPELEGGMERLRLSLLEFCERESGAA